MIHPAIPATLLALTAPAVAGLVGVPDPGQVTMAQLTIHERIIIRVPRMPSRFQPGRTPMTPPVAWTERKGPKCIKPTDLAGALITAANAIDLVMIGGTRIRARLDGECRPLDFYAGLYVRPGPDGLVCADRDAIRVRSGASCAIEAFRVLKPAR